MKRYVIVSIMLSIFIINPVHSSARRDFDDQTLSELVSESGFVFRVFGENNLSQSDTTLFIRNQIIPKHGTDMYALWSSANNWGNAGKGGLREIRDRLQQSIASVSNLPRAKEIIKGKLKDKSFSLINNLSERSLKEKALLTVQNGRLKIEKDLIGGGYDIIFQHKFSGDVGLTQTKEYDELPDDPALSSRHGAKVMVVVVGMYEFLDAIWELTQTSGMTTRDEVIELLPSHPGRIKSIYVIQDYDF